MKQKWVCSNFMNDEWCNGANKCILLVQWALVMQITNIDTWQNLITTNSFLWSHSLNPFVCHCFWNTDIYIKQSNLTGSEEFVIILHKSLLYCASIYYLLQ